MTTKADLLKHLPQAVLARVALTAKDGDTIEVSIEEYAKAYQRISQLEAALKRAKQRGKR